MEKSLLLNNETSWFFFFHVPSGIYAYIWKINHSQNGCLTVPIVKLFLWKSVLDLCEDKATKHKWRHETKTDSCTNAAKKQEFKCSAQKSISPFLPLYSHSKVNVNNEARGMFLCKQIFHCSTWWKEEKLSCYIKREQSKHCLWMSLYTMVSSTACLWWRSIWSGNGDWWGKILLQSYFKLNRKDWESRRNAVNFLELK